MECMTKIAGKKLFVDRQPIMHLMASSTITLVRTELKKGKK